MLLRRYVRYYLVAITLNIIHITVVTQSDVDLYVASTTLPILPFIYIYSTYGCIVDMDVCVQEHMSYYSQGQVAYVPQQVCKGMKSYDSI